MAVRTLWIATIAGALALAVPTTSSAASPAKKAATKKGPSIVLPARKGKPAAPEKRAPGRGNQPEKVDIPGVTGSNGNGNGGGAPNLADELRGPTRSDFDDRLIHGQH